MGTTCISFIYKSTCTNLETTEQIEKEYQKIYKPLIKFLFTHPDFHFTFYFSGNSLLYYKKKRPELISLLKQLVERSQIEILGGGFYNPFLPLLYTADRNGQLDLLSSEIRQLTGKRPRGASLFCDCWDSSLINNLVTCGFEYVLLDSSYISQKKQSFIPLIMSTLGKAITILPLYDTDSFDGDIDAYLKEKLSKAIKKDGAFQPASDRIVCVNISKNDIQKMINEESFEKIYNSLKGSEEFSTELPSLYLKKNTTKEICFIPAGINSKDAAKILTEASYPDPCSENTSVKKNINTVYELFEESEAIQKLYNRLLYVSLLVNQYKNDKMRKNAAREKLWQSQNGKAFYLVKTKERQQAYRLLMEAEKILREDNSFKETFTCFDYNNDGTNEYVCRMQNYFAYIASTGGAIHELSVLKNTGNYADNVFDEKYSRGIFVDHVFTKSQFENYKTGLSAGSGIFSKVNYNQIKYSQGHHELLLGATAYFGSSKQKLFLRKKYIINSAGIIIQYILRNESEKPFNAIFAVESNFANVNIDYESPSYYRLESVEEDKKIEIDTSKSLLEQNGNDFLKDIDLVRLSDTLGGISFTFEPNEKSHYIFYPLLRYKKDENGVLSENPVQMSFVSTLFWDVNIDSGKEIEKTINFTITNIKKERKNKNSL